MNTERKIICYMDRTDFECELGRAADGNKLYPSVKAAKKYNPKCIEECGVVEVEVRFVRVVEPGKRKDGLNETDS